MASSSQQLDRLSDLPDSILTHILSFLPTRISVRTSVLSRRYRFLWTEVPSLDFFDENQNFIKKVMQLHKLQNINKFRLEMRYDLLWDDHNLEKWVTAAIDRKVQILELFVTFEILPSERLFSSTTVVDLTLISCDVSRINGAVCLPRLKKLHLYSPGFDTNEFLPLLLSGCPVLEELLIEDLFLRSVSCIISSPTIKRLVLKFLDTNDRFNRLEINTPAVEYLEIADRFPFHVEFGQVTSLVEANIRVNEDEKEQLDNVRYSRAFLGFIDRLSNVKCLKLDLPKSKWIVDSVLSAWTTNFRNLTKLELTADCRFVSKFLEYAHNLEILILAEEQNSGFNHNNDCPHAYYHVLEL